MADAIYLMLAESAHAGAEAHAEPAVFGILNATVWVSLAMLLLIGVMVWKKVPAMVGAMLDSRIAAIRAQLDEAAALRREAEALRGEYQAKLAALDAEADAMRQRAEQDAAALVSKAKDDVKTLIARRQKMAEERIAAAERAAIGDVRSAAANAAVAAARDLIATGHGADADQPLVDDAIAALGKA